MYEERDRIKRRIHQIEREYTPDAYVIEKGGIIPKSKHPTQEISQELECLKARLQELNEKDDKAHRKKLNSETTKIE